MLQVVGSLSELGSWSPSTAPQMNWSEGHRWSLECTLPKTSFEFKIIATEGGHVRWEGGANRVVQADEDGEDLPVEVVVYLTCHYNQTESTGMALALPRANIQDAYETGRATLEFLRKRRSKLSADSHGNDASMAERMRHAQEMARLSEALAEQSSTVDALGDMLGVEPQPGAHRGIKAPRGPVAAIPATSSADSDTEAEPEADASDHVLLLAIDSVRMPPALRRISFANVLESWNGPSLLSAASAAGSTDGPPAPSPFMRGELDSRAEELISAAQELLRREQSRATGTASGTDGASSGSPTPGSSPAGSPTASADLEAGLVWASLAEEAGLVAGALATLGGDGAAQAQMQQLQGLASVGSSMAAVSNGNGNGYSNGNGNGEGYRNGNGYANGNGYSNGNGNGNGRHVEADGSGSPTESVELPQPVRELLAARMAAAAREAAAAAAGASPAAAGKASGSAVVAAAASSEAPSSPTATMHSARSSSPPSKPQGQKRMGLGSIASAAFSALGFGPLGFRLRR